MAQTRRKNEKIGTKILRTKESFASLKPLNPILERMEKAVAGVHSLRKKLSSLRYESSSE